MGKRDEFFVECEASPRLNEMTNFFSSTAAGRSGAPIRRPVPDVRLFQGDNGLLRFMNAHRALWGNFDLHYFGSIPYRLEEEIRLGEAMLRYCRTKSTAGKPVLVYTLGTAEGTLARCLGVCGKGNIQTLSCSPNKENRDCFFLYGKPQNSVFFLGSFHELRKSIFDECSCMNLFQAGFDIIVEDTTFQMYSPNRGGQIEFVKQHLKRDGIMIFVEKFNNDEDSEYMRRELQKDYGYKSRYFDCNDIEEKKHVILETMKKNEVTIQEMASAVNEHFKHCYITWNSGNFYTVVAGNNSDSIASLISSMVPPCIPNEYVYTRTPMALLLDAPSHIAYRKFQGSKS